MENYACAYCAVRACRTGETERIPANCPMRREGFFEGLLDEYRTEENRKFYLTSTAIEALGYCRWPRLRETVEFAKRMGYTRLGVGFCAGLHSEARIVCDVLRAQGFEVVSVVCKTGGVPKTAVGFDASWLTDADGAPIEPDAEQQRLLCSRMCNPIAQATLLNEAHTQFNLCIGLCVGHDSLFYRYCDAPVTTLVAKDRVTGHNPVAAIYGAEGYFKKRLSDG